MTTPKKCQIIDEEKKVFIIFNYFVSPKSNIYNCKHCGCEEKKKYLDRYVQSHLDFCPTLAMIHSYLLHEHHNAIPYLKDKMMPEISEFDANVISHLSHVYPEIEDVLSEPQIDPNVGVEMKNIVLFIGDSTIVVFYTPFEKCPAPSTPKSTPSTTPVSTPEVTPKKSAKKKLGMAAWDGLHPKKDEIMPDPRQAENGIEDAVPVGAIVVPPPTSPTTRSKTKLSLAATTK